MLLVSLTKIQVCMSLGVLQSLEQTSNHVTFRDLTAVQKTQSAEIEIASFNLCGIDPNLLTKNAKDTGVGLLLARVLEFAINCSPP